MLEKCVCALCDRFIVEGSPRVEEIDERGDENAHHVECWDELVASELAVTQDLALERASA